MGQVRESPRGCRLSEVWIAVRRRSYSFVRYKPGFDRAIRNRFLIETRPRGHFTLDPYFNRGKKVYVLIDPLLGASGNKGARRIPKSELVRPNKRTAGMVHHQHRSYQRQPQNHDRGSDGTEP